MRPSLFDLSYKVFQSKNQTCIHQSLLTAPAPSQVLNKCPLIKQMNTLQITMHAESTASRSAQSQAIKTHVRNGSHGPTCRHSRTIRHSECIRLCPSCIFRRALSASEMLKSRHNEAAVNVAGTSKGWFDHIQRGAAGFHQREFRECGASEDCLMGAAAKAWSRRLCKQGRGAPRRFCSCLRNENNGKQRDTAPGTENLNLLLTSLPTRMTLIRLSAKLLLLKGPLSKAPCTTAQRTLRKTRQRQHFLRPECWQNCPLILACSSYRHWSHCNCISLFTPAARSRS